MKNWDMYYLYNPETHEVTSTKDMLEWGEFFKSTDRQIERTEVEGVLISTVFLGIDHGFFGGEPILFETMIFGGIHNDYQERYSTYEEAMEGHKKAVLMAKAAYN